MKKKNRIPWGKEPHICHDDPIGNCYDCGCKEGDIHDYGCDMEECPVCHSQFMGCSEKCIDKLDHSERNSLLNELKKRKDHEVKSWDIDFKLSDPFGGKKEDKKGKYVLPGGEYCL